MIAGDLFVVANDLGHDEGQELLGKLRVEPRRIGKGSKPLDLTALPIRIGGRKSCRRLKHTDLLSDLETFGQQTHQRSIEVVDT